MRTSYQTQQKAALLSFLEQNAERQFTIDEILSAMGEIAPAKSTAYRLIKSSAMTDRCAALPVKARRAACISLRVSAAARSTCT